MCCRACCYGAQISLTVGLVGIAISFTLGLLLGGIAGYFGGFVDTVIMRMTELLLSIPSLYLIIALRAVFPMDLPSQQVYLGIVAILAFIGWAGLARVIRGLVLSMRKSDFVTAAEALGFGRLRVIARHILPNTMSYVIVAATLSIPGYILGEVVLSFLGVGVQEPSASWGNMLNQARSIRALTIVPVAAVRARHGDLPDGHGVQLPRRRPARRARSAHGCSGGSAHMSELALLRLENLKTYFYTDTAVIRAVDGVSFEVNAGRDAGGRRRVGQRQERHGALDSEARAPAARPHRRRADPVQGARSRSADERSRCARSAARRSR